MTEATEAEGGGAFEGIYGTGGGTIRATIERYVRQPVTCWSAVRRPPICNRGGKFAEWGAVAPAALPALLLGRSGHWPGAVPLAVRLVRPRHHSATRVPETSNGERKL